MDRSLESKTVFRFLDLPREIRDRVYLFVLTSRHCAPKSPKEDRSLWQKSRQGRMGKMWYRKVVSNFTCAGLLACNRQMSREMIEAIERHNAMEGEGVRYHMDCIVTGDGTLWPAWTGLPAPLKYLKIVELDLRIYHDEVSSYGIRWAGDGGPGPIVSNLLWLLGHFLTWGPQLRCNVCQQRTDIGRPKLLCKDCQEKEVQVETLQINFVPSQISKEQLVSRWSEEAYPSEEDRQAHRRELRNDPENGFLWGLEGIVEELSCSGLVFGKINRIRLTCGDDKRETIPEDKGALQKDATAKLWAPYGWVPGQFSS